MNTSDISILKDFQSESKALIQTLIQILEDCEGDFGKVKSLEKYGQTVDRIMGGAKSMQNALESASPFIQSVGDYAAVCKAVGYKASQIKDNEQFYDICVALLLDATEVLQDLVEHLFDEDQKSLKSFINQAFLERLKWVSNIFGAEYRASVQVQTEASPKMNQAEIDELIKKLGLD